ncbi:hypothetical protein AVEN_192985-1 [Araneus ventricosus]|uniref:Uncharacterized protein n=1 Tax=Araneus ventricosus TaxID=182803 RepID=A0A4Y2PR62_ARAVE|nr:hypothetical protein AVEN_192985-1 [Araneus ventricosus]
MDVYLLTMELPDLRNKCLRDTKTKLQSVGHLKYADLHSVQISISKDTIYHKLLKEFPSITKLPNPNQPVKHTTVHHIVTKGPPVVAKPRRLAPHYFTFSCITILVLSEWQKEYILPFCGYLLGRIEFDDRLFY